MFCNLSERLQQKPWKKCVKVPRKTWRNEDLQIWRDPTSPARPAQHSASWRPGGNVSFSETGLLQLVRTYRSIVGALFCFTAPHLFSFVFATATCVLFSEVDSTIRESEVESETARQRGRAREINGSVLQARWRRGRPSLSPPSPILTPSLPFPPSLSSPPKSCLRPRPRPLHPHHHRTRRQAKNLTHRARLHTSQLPLAGSSSIKLPRRDIGDEQARSCCQGVVKARIFHACRGDSGVESRGRARQPRSMDLGAWRDSL